MLDYLELHYFTANMSKIVVLGGGISGLSAAFYLARSLAAKAACYEITLIDKGELGGWVQSVDTGKGRAGCSTAGVTNLGSY